MLLSSHGHIIIYAVVIRRSLTQPTAPVNDYSLCPLLNLRILRIPHEIILAQKLYFSETPSKMNFAAKVQHIFPDSKFSQGRKEGRERDRKGALDIFRGIIVRGNINLYAAIIALAFSNGKEKRKSWSCLCSPRSNGSKTMG